MFGAEKTGDVEAAGQTQGIEEALLHQHVEAQTGHFFEDRAHDAVVEVAVLEEDAGSPVDAVFGDLEPLTEIGVGRVERLLQRSRVANDVGLTGVADRRDMGEQVSEGDGTIGVVRIAELPPQVVGDVAIQVERAFLHQLHDDDGGKGLGDRCHPHEVVGT